MEPMAPSATMIARFSRSLKSSIRMVRPHQFLPFKILQWTQFDSLLGRVISIYFQSLTGISNRRIRH
jgi:hypothetical protein